MIGIYGIFNKTLILGLVTFLKSSRLYSRIKHQSKLITARALMN